MKRPYVMLSVILALVLAAAAVSAQGVEANKAWVKEKQGIKILHLAGTPYEMGVQRGTLLKDAVREQINNIWLKPVKQLLGDNLPIARRMVERVAALCPDYVMEELRGIAKGADLPEEDVIFATLVPDQLQYLGAGGRSGAQLSTVPTLLSAPLGCSNFACFGRATKSGELYHGVNFDWAKELGIQKHYLVVAREPADGAPFVTIGWAGSLYTCATMNAHKISTGMIGAGTINTSNYGVPMGIIHRRIAQEASTISDAISILSSVRRTPGGMNYVIGDGNAPDAVAVETDAKHASVWGANDPREQEVFYAIPVMDAVVRSDEAMDPRLRDAQTCTKGDPTKPGLEAPWGTESYDHRYKGLAVGILHNFGLIDDAKALELVREAAMEGANMHSVLWCNSRLEFYLAISRGYEDAAKGTYVHFTWSELFPGS